MLIVLDVVHGSMGSISNHIPFHSSSFRRVVARLAVHQLSTLQVFVVVKPLLLLLSLLMQHLTLVVQDLLHQFIVSLRVNAILFFNPAVTS